MLYGKNKSPHLKTKNPSNSIKRSLESNRVRKDSIYRKMDEGSFPKCLKLGAPIKEPTQFDSRAIAWIEEEVEKWVEERIEERDSSLNK